MKKNEISIKITLVGADLTGKTTLLEYLSNDRLNKAEYEIYKPTNGASYMAKKYIYNNQRYTLDLWDTSGILKYRSYSKFFARDSKVVLFFYDALNIESFEVVKELLTTIQENRLNEQIYILVCNKYQLSLEDRKGKIISDEEALEFAEENGLLFCHLSMFDKYENGINELMIKILKKYNEIFIKK